MKRTPTSLFLAAALATSATAQEPISNDGLMRYEGSVCTEAQCSLTVPKDTTVTVIMPGYTQEPFFEAIITTPAHRDGIIVESDCAYAVRETNALAHRIAGASKNISPEWQEAVSGFIHYIVPDICPLDYDPEEEPPGLDADKTNGAPPLGAPQPKPDLIG